MSAIKTKNHGFIRSIHVPKDMSVDFRADPKYGFVHVSEVNNELAIRHAREKHRMSPYDASKISKSEEDIGSVLRLCKTDDPVKINLESDHLQMMIAIQDYTLNFNRTPVSFEVCPGMKKFAGFFPFDDASVRGRKVFDDLHEFGLITYSRNGHCWLRKHGESVLTKVRAILASMEIERRSKRTAARSNGNTKSSSKAPQSN